METDKIKPAPKGAGIKLYEYCYYSFGIREFRA